MQLESILFIQMSKTKPLPEASFLWERFSLNPLTGTLYLRKGPYKGQRAGTLPKSDTYAYIRIKKEPYLTHRLIYKWITGIEPGEVVEHDDDNRLNNRPWNLTDSTERNNHATRSKLSGRSLPLGITVIQRKPTHRKRYVARITIKGTVYCLGTFNTPDEASEARNLFLLERESW